MKTSSLVLSHQQWCLLKAPLPFQFSWRKKLPSRARGMFDIIIARDRSKDFGRLDRKTQRTTHTQALRKKKSRTCPLLFIGEPYSHHCRPLCKLVEVRWSNVGLVIIWATIFTNTKSVVTGERNPMKHRKWWSERHQIALQYHFRLIGKSSTVPLAPFISEPFYVRKSIQKHHNHCFKYSQSRQATQIASLL